MLGDIETSSNNFLTDEDIYNFDKSWTTEDAYCCYRYITHLVGRASTRKQYGEKLAAIRFDELPNEVLVMFKLALDDAFLAKKNLTVAQMRVIDAAKPIVPALKLSENPRGYPDYERMGLLL